MKTIGFIASEKIGESRRAMLPKDAAKLAHPAQFFVQQGYGTSVGFTDADYQREHVQPVPRAQAMQCDIICDVKLGDGDFVPQLAPGKTLFGWAHAAQKIDFATAAIQGKHTVIAWEEMDEGGRNIFYRNREIAGEAAVLQAFMHFGRMPYETKVAILGRGNTAKGAFRILNGLGAAVDVYGRKMEDLFCEKIGQYDVLVNCVMWDPLRKDRLLTRADLARMRPGSMIIDVSSDGDLAIETAHATTIEDPVYTVDGILHYAVDNTPALFGRTASGEISAKVCEMAELLVQGKTHPLLEKSTVIKDGIVVNKTLRAFRQARGLPCG
ncbi:N(5)-(carboxyethyl)ornithine synthase [Ruminococcaceae bacterium OttesenSCG-928-A16]|nr:N(5)-(carboxyethyl)ornithine synthase [Ruminococcaceae bacterium OttesenSCG-928-A16]